MGGVDPAWRALRHFTADPEATLDPLGGGLINQTYRFRAADRCGVLQHLNPIFPPAINDDIDRVTSHLSDRGMATPRLLRCLDGASWLDLGHDGVWRALSWIEGTTLARPESADTVFEAGALLGRFHSTVADLPIDFVFQRVVHDTSAHLGKLRALAQGDVETAVRTRVEPLARRILAAGDALPDLPGAAARILHGDPKLDNVRFDRAGRRAVCLVDLDTLRRGPLAHDLGDAWRSWCNRAGEDEPDAELDLVFLGAAAEGHASTSMDLVTADEVAGFGIALRCISVELAARFCADAYEDRYFGWNPDRFASRREHNLVRARGQLSLGLAVEQAWPQIAAIIRRAFGRR